MSTPPRETGREAVPVKTKVTRTKGTAVPATQVLTYSVPGTQAVAPQTYPQMHVQNQPHTAPRILSVPLEGEGINQRNKSPMDPRRNDVTQAKHVSSSNLYASLQTQYLENQGLTSPPRGVPLRSGSESSTKTPFEVPPTIEIDCDNYGQMRKIRAYLAEGQKKFQTDKDEIVLLKLFSEKFGMVGEANAIGYNDDFFGSYTWEWKSGQTWIPFLEYEQELLETAYQSGENSVTFPITKEKEFGSLVVDLKKLIQVNTGNQTTQSVRRNHSTIFTEGWILKESSKLKVWKLVYGVLHCEGVLLYTDESKVSLIQKLPFDAIFSVKSSLSFSGKEFCFTLDVWKGEMRGMNFSVATENILKKWIFYLNLGRKKNLLKKAKEIIVGKPDFILDLSSENDSRYSICFCSISTAAYKFDPDIASTVACEVFASFLNKHPKAPVKIYLVDREKSHTIELFQKKRPQDPRMKVCCANLVKLKTEANIPCWYIVNASNPKFNEGGSGTNEAIHEACRGQHTPSLQTLTRKLYNDNAELSEAYPVRLPEGCPLREKEDVRYVIHVVGPNMNPKRPNYLGDDGYPKGKEELKKCYTNILTKFWELTGLED